MAVALPGWAALSLRCYSLGSVFAHGSVFGCLCKEDMYPVECVKGHTPSGVCKGSVYYTRGEYTREPAGRRLVQAFIACSGRWPQDNFSFSRAHVAPEDISGAQVSGESWIARVGRHAITSTRQRINPVFMFCYSQQRRCALKSKHTRFANL